MGPSSSDNKAVVLASIRQIERSNFVSSINDLLSPSHDFVLMVILPTERQDAVLFLRLF